MNTCLTYCNLYFVMNNIVMCILYTNPFVESYQISIIILYLLLIHDFFYYCFHCKKLDLLLLIIFYLSFINFMLCWNIPLVYFVFLNVLWKYLFIYHDVKIDSELMEKKKHFKTMFSTFPPCQNTETECYICLETNEESPGLQYLPCFHPFHEKCFTTWILSNPNQSTECPVCRRPVWEVDFC